MNALKSSQKLLYKIAESVAPRNEKEHRQQRLTAVILILLAAAALFYQAIT